MSFFIFFYLNPHHIFLSLLLNTFEDISLLQMHIDIFIQTNLSAKSRALLTQLFYYSPFLPVRTFFSLGTHTIPYVIFYPTIALWIWSPDYPDHCNEPKTSVTLPMKVFFSLLCEHKTIFFPTCKYFGVKYRVVGFFYLVLMVITLLLHKLTRRVD